MEQNNKVILFDDKHIRRIWHEDAWFFSVVDVIGVLTDSLNPSDYWYQLKKREKKSAGVDLSTNCRKMKMPALDGKDRPTDVANREALLRILMAIPSPKAEPFKLWLARVGEERFQEIENPELGFDRLKDIYKAKGYSDEWIESRLKTIGIRKELTEEWQKRGVKEGQEYSILTAEIAKATFGLTPSEHKTVKKLGKENLRDHMTNLELIFTMLGEEASRQVSIKDDAQGFEENHDAAQRGGAMAGDARQSFEKREGLQVVSPENFLKQIEEAEKKNTLPEVNA